MHTTATNSSTWYPCVYDIDRPMDSSFEPKTAVLLTTLDLRPEALTPVCRCLSLSLAEQRSLQQYCSRRSREGGVSFATAVPEDTSTRYHIES